MDTRTFRSKGAALVVLLAAVAAAPGCAAPATLTGYAVNTPRHNPEAKVFYLARLSGEAQHHDRLVPLEHCTR